MPYFMLWGQDGDDAHFLPTLRCWERRGVFAIWVGSPAHDGAEEEVWGSSQNHPHNWNVFCDP